MKLACLNSVSFSILSGVCTINRLCAPSTEKWQCHCVSCFVRVWCSKLDKQNLILFSFPLKNLFPQWFEGSVSLAGRTFFSLSLAKNVLGSWLSQDLRKKHERNLELFCFCTVNCEWNYIVLLYLLTSSIFLLLHFWEWNWMKNFPFCLQIHFLNFLLFFFCFFNRYMCLFSKTIPLFVNICSHLVSFKKVKLNIINITKSNIIWTFELFRSFGEKVLCRLPLSSQ